MNSAVVISRPTWHCTPVCQVMTSWPHWQCTPLPQDSAATAGVQRMYLGIPDDEQVPTVYRPSGDSHADCADSLFHHRRRWRHSVCDHTRLYQNCRQAHRVLRGQYHASSALQLLVVPVSETYKTLDTAAVCLMWHAISGTVSCTSC